MRRRLQTAASSAFSTGVRDSRQKASSAGAKAPSPCHGTASQRSNGIAGRPTGGDLPLGPSIVGKRYGQSAGSGTAPGASAGRKRPLFSAAITSAGDFVDAEKHEGQIVVAGDDRIAGRSPGRW